jgi:transcriptional regulator with XRE-family HTH domain
MSRTVNQRIKFLRHETKLTQKEFSGFVGITETALSRIETGDSKPTPQTLKDIQKKFNLPVEWLYDGKGEFSFRYSGSPNISPDEDHPWRDEAYQSLKTQLDKKDMMIEKLQHQMDGIISLLAGKLGKLKDSEIAARLHKMGTVSGSKVVELRPAA